MRLQLCTWQDVEQYLERSTGILIPLGSTEQHGPLGLLGTDAICPETVAWAAAERAGALVAPTLSLGMAQHHLAFPGTIALLPSTLVAVIRDVVHSLLRHGFDHLLFLNGHGGNIASVLAAFSELYAEQSLELHPRERPYRLKLVNWWETEAVAALCKELYGDSEGSHATPSEISLTWHAYPEAAKKSAALDPEVAPHGEIHDAEDLRRQFPDGRIGSNSALASREAGRRLYEASVGDLEQAYRAFLEE